jgi:hypothetical protein
MLTGLQLEFRRDIAWAILGWLGATSATRGTTARGRIAVDCSPGPACSDEFQIDCWCSTSQTVGKICCEVGFFAFALGVGIRGVDVRRQDCIGGGLKG